MILDEILDHTRAAAAAREATLDVEALERRAMRAPAPRSLRAALQRARGIALIGEVKRRSPSAGQIATGELDPAARAHDYEAAGASAISVLTNERFFGGSFADLAQVRKRVQVPVLCKDFLLDRVQLLEARAAGADAVLLIVRALGKARLRTLLDESHSLGMEALVEVHDEAEMEIAASVGAQLIGINNRDLDTLAVDLATTGRLAGLAPTGTVIVSESGVRTRADVERMQATGASAILVGHTLMRSSDPQLAIRTLLGSPDRTSRRTRVKLCGCTSVSDVDAAVAAGADRIGVVLEPGLHRSVKPDELRAMRERLDALGEQRPQLVGVFVDAGIDVILRTASDYRLDAIQLSGPASIECTQALIDRGIATIATVHVGRPGSDPDTNARTLAGIGSEVLLDAYTPDAAGGTGCSIDLDAASRIARTLPNVTLAGGLTPAHVAAAVQRVRPAYVDVSSGIEIDGRKDPQLMATFVEEATRAPGRYGAFGGAYVPEVVMPAVERLTRAWNELRDRPEFARDFAALCRDYVGRPTPLFEARGLTAHAGGARIFLKREDLAHTGAHKINNALGQALLARHMGISRIVAETGAGQHGVAAATVSALLGLDCTVHMGEVDMERQQPNVFRMRLLGATIEPVADGSRTLKEATSSAIRAWAADPDGTYYLVGSAVGMHPYPEIVRELQSVIGREMREQIVAHTGTLPAAVVACVGGGSNAIGSFHPFLDADEVALYGAEAGGTGSTLGQHAASLSLGSPGVLHGAHTMVLQDAHGQIVETHSVSAGLDYPGVGPEHAHLRATGRASYEPVGDDDALAALGLTCRLEGIVPALESAHAIALGLRVAARLPDDTCVCITLSGRGDKDLATLVAREGELA